LPVNFELSISEIERMIDIRFDWENCWYKTAEDVGCYRLIQQSRYQRYTDLVPVIFIFSFGNNQVFDLVKLLARVYFIHSVRFQKAINAIHTWTNNLMKSIVSGHSANEVLDLIKMEIGDFSKHNQGYNHLDWYLAMNLTDNLKRKYLVCRLSALLEENFSTTDESEIKKIEKKVFHSPVDIEHIQSFHDADGKIREDIWKKWGNSINSLGNLMILEEKINRSIGNKPYLVKRPRYYESEFEVVKIQAERFYNWDLPDAERRMQTEKEKLIQYLFTY
jgi:hypothetical protein